jgi:26S proteasome non-ATPase regulatory subunit 10
LHWAVSFNHLPIVELLLEAKNLDIDAQDGLGWTPLMMACSRKDGEAIVDLLLRKDADVNMKSMSIFKKHHGCGNSRADTETDNNNQTALHFVSSKANLDVAKTLLAHSASARVKDKRGQLPLHRAAAVGSVPMLKLLLSAKSPLNATDIDGMTALHHAVSEGHGDAALFLLTSGAEWDKKDNEGHLALDLAPDAKVSFSVRHGLVAGMWLTRYRLESLFSRQQNVRA